MRNGDTETAGRSLYKRVIFRFPPAFLISQKSEIFDSFPPGEAFAPAALVKLNYNLSYELFAQMIDFFYNLCDNCLVKI